MSLSEYTVEDLIKELQTRGLSITVNNTVSKVGPSLFSPLAEIEEYFRISAHKWDRYRDIKTLFMNFTKTDWARKTKNLASDAKKYVVIGIGETGYDDKDILLIKHFDTERKAEQSNGWSTTPAEPVWTIGFTGEEFVELTKNVVSNVEKSGTLIHREPQGDVDPDEPWYQESHWLIENGKITGIKVVMKCTQDDEPTTKIVRFKVRGTVFEKNGKIETIMSKGSQSNSANRVPLPSKITNYVPVSYPKEQLTTKNDYECEGDSPITLKYGPRKRFEDPVRHYNRSNGLYQVVKSPTCTITNPTDNAIAITEYWMEFCDKQGNFYKCSSERAGIPTVDWQGTPTAHWIEDRSFPLQEHDTFELVFEGTVERLADGDKLPYRMLESDGRNRFRIHPEFPEPLACNVVLKDDQGRTRSLKFENVNDVVDHPWTTYEDALQAGQTSEGVNEDYQCDMCLVIENHVTLNKAGIIITTAKNNPTGWYIRTEASFRSMPGGYAFATPDTFKQCAYKAKLEGKTEWHFSGWSYDDVRVYGLIDAATGQMYALKGEIEIKHNGETVTHVTDYMYIDYDRVQQAAPEDD